MYNVASPKSKFNWIILNVAQPLYIPSILYFLSSDTEVI